MRPCVLTALTGVVILASNLFVSPILNVAYLSSLAVIGGARSTAQVTQFIQLAFWKLMRLSWVSSPIAMAFAQRFVSPDLCACFVWVIVAHGQGSRSSLRSPASSARASV